MTSAPLIGLARLLVATMFLASSLMLVSSLGLMDTEENYDPPLAVESTTVKPPAPVKPLYEAEVKHCLKRLHIPYGFLEALRGRVW